MLFPSFDNELDLYDHFGLLSSGRSILAHCCYMSEYEIGRLLELRAGIAHCPVSNMTVGGGFMAAPVRRLLRHGIPDLRRFFDNDVRMLEQFS